ncbi:MAG: phage tail tape measure protein, partial [Treponema sp.]|nr:phage tail tape measure protein [Treponema sp.]
MNQELTEELRVLVTAEVDKAVKALQGVDKKTKETEKLFKSLGGAIGAAFSAKAMLDFARSASEAWRKQREAVNVLNSVIAATGAAAWTSGAELQDMASALQKVTNYGDEAVISMQGVLLGFRNIKGDNFEHASKAILDMATVMKMDLSSAAQVVGKALDDPINGLGSLSRQGFRFTEEQKKMIAAMVEAGDVMGAQKIILEELDGTYGGAAEAAADLGTQVKNAAGDVMEGFGKVFAYLGENSGAMKLALSLLNETADAFNNFERNAARISGGEKYQDWFNAQSNEEKLKEATDQIRIWKKEYEDAKRLSDEAGGKDWVLLRDANKAKKELDDWKVRKENLEEEIKLGKDRAALKQAAANAEDSFNKTLSETDKLYKSLAKDEPAEKLKELQKQLDEINEKRKSFQLVDTKELERELQSLSDAKIELSRSASLIGGAVAHTDLQKQLSEMESQIQRTRERIAAGKAVNAQIASVDSKELAAQLDEAERIVREKMAEIARAGRKTWQEHFSETTGVDKSLFSTGEQAAEEYIKGLEARMKNEEELGALLGKALSPKKRLEAQQREIEETIKKLLAIPEEEFLNANGGFETKDNAIKKLIDEYKKLGESIKDLPDDAPQYSDAFDRLAASVENAILKIGELDAVQAKALGNLAGNLASVSFAGVQSGVTELAEKLGEGADASEAWAAGLEEMAMDILNQLPMLFTQAGLMLIGQGMWPIGLGLLAAGLGTGIVAGVTNGIKNAGSKGASANALGGVYGEDGLQAFALGGAFTNSVVSRPTFFKFRNGSGFSTGVMGEAGPEAIMPLARGSDGSLGVRVAG